jgi:hypothetical protein
MLAESDDQHLVLHLPYFGLDAIVLAYRGDLAELLFDGGGVADVFATTVAQPIDDPSRQAPLLRQALSRESADALRARTRLDAVTSQEPRTLAVIRQRLIDEHSADRVNRSQLDALLRAFDLAPLNARSQVAFTITGTYLVDHADTDAAYTDGHTYLAASFSNLKGFVPGSAVTKVVIDTVVPAG